MAIGVKLIQLIIIFSFFVQLLLFLNNKGMLFMVGKVISI